VSSAPPREVAATSATVAPSTRDRLLDATETCLRRHGIRRTTVTEIADEAGMSRAGLYKHFPDKASLVVTALARTDEQFWADADARVSAAPDISAKVTEAVRIASEHQPGALLLQLKADEPDVFAATVGTGLTQMVPGMAAFWLPHLEGARRSGEVREDLDVASAAEWILRIVLSLVTVPGDWVDSHDPSSVRAYVDEYVLPSLR
jgi:AcrR family transcriptional regulator